MIVTIYGEREGGGGYYTIHRSDFHADVIPQVAISAPVNKRLTPSAPPPPSKSESYCGHCFYPICMS